jgi:hypothetical protein
VSNREPHMGDSLATIIGNGVYQKPVGVAEEGGTCMLLPKNRSYMISNPGCDSLLGLKAEK